MRENTQSPSEGGLKAPQAYGTALGEGAYGLFDGVQGGLDVVALDAVVSDEAQAADHAAAERRRAP